MRNVLTVTLCLVATFAGVLPALAQPPAPAPDEVAKKPFIGSTRFGFDPTVIQPGSHVFFADARGDNEIEVFKDGKLAVDLQLSAATSCTTAPKAEFESASTSVWASRSLMRRRYS